MKIGIIGAGNIGSTLTRRFAQLGHEVFVANSRGPESLASLTEETGAKALSPAEAARTGEVVVIAIPEGRIRDLPKDLFSGVSEDVVVVDTGNYYPNGMAKYKREADGAIQEIEAGMPESRWVEQQLGRPVVKAFNTIMSSDLMNLGRPKEAPSRIALPVAGDNRKAKETVVSLIDQLGFDTVDVGGLDESWRQQPGTPVYVANLKREDLKRGLMEADPERKPEWRAASDSQGTAAGRA